MPITGPVTLEADMRAHMGPSPGVSEGADLHATEYRLGYTERGIGTRNSFYFFSLILHSRFKSLSTLVSAENISRI